MTFFDSAMYETRFCGFVAEEGTSKAAMNRSVAYSESSRRINEWTLGDTISISRITSLTATWTGLILSISGGYSGEKLYVRISDVV